jgi:hypothetical protein
MAEKFGQFSQAEQEKSIEGREVETIDLNDLGKGDMLIVNTALKEEEQGNQYDIMITGKRKDIWKRDRGEETEYSWMIEVVENNDQDNAYKAKMPGGFMMKSPAGVGITPGLISLATEQAKNCLLFEQLRDKKTNEPKAKSTRTTPIRKIVLVKKKI